MDIAKARLFLYLTLIMIGFALYSAWLQEHPSRVDTQISEESTSAPHAASNSIKHSNLPSMLSDTAETPMVGRFDEQLTASAQRLITIESSVLSLQVDLNGGDIVTAQLKKYPQKISEPSEGFHLLDKAGDRAYFFQSGLISDDGPDSYSSGRGVYRAEKEHYQLESEQEWLEVPIYWQNDRGLLVVKRFRLYPDQYRIGVESTVTNHQDTVWKGSAYGQISRKKPLVEKSGFFGMQSYTGGAFNTADKPFKKISFEDFTKDNTFKMSGGWAAMVERYFISAWIPSKSETSHFYTKTTPQNDYVLGAISNPLVVNPQESVTTHSQLYLGPELVDRLDTIDGLELTVDYGILWPVSAFLFWTLKHIHSWVANWGWSIIILTLLIKLCFYKLSATSYRSMGRMRKLQPRIESLKEQYSEDKATFSQKMMELYRKEKVNPLGGCLPILIQIPVFIAFYYMLLESVDLRQAPFILWIQDLSIKDPFFVLPVLMGVTMLIQQKLNPAPPDPVQAKVMMALPFVFTFLFMQFPAGLVLYWVVNNTLSIAQQWFIMRRI